MEKVKDLRRITDAGIKECKATLEETGWDLDKAVKALREKGIAKADTKSGRATKEGMISCYLHQNKIAGLVELACETDFVARTEVFQNLAKDLAVQVVTSSPKSLKKEDLSPELIEAEKEIYYNQEKKAGKPEKIIGKIVEGKIEKFFKESCFYDQPFYKDESKTVDEVVKEAIAKTGENIQIKRFFRMQLGEE
ncbi:elongation factor Ts [candidate division WOR-3 bacterium]|nr:elongation factor Ts [candidate division WOR-3 bacterium]